MCHVGFQQLYMQQTVQGGESPKDTIHRLVEEHKDKLDKITVVGHSLGGGERGNIDTANASYRVMLLVAYVFRFYLSVLKSGAFLQGSR